ncbi:MAG: hypothetical protein A3K10_11495 [Bacteroidetes bacterium RIFCSPLOWO2_12_FULL_31_6]|nr:MAG: hypothetical protein A3K10_11495 [Bacteroidetes bacterium RIFCSPLOWO2_12_FULL_31_6]
MKILKYIIVVIIIGLSFIIGLICRNIPIVTLNTEVKIFEPINFILTLLIGISIPFFIKRWIEDNRQIKNFIIDELKTTLREVEIVKDKLKFCYVQKTISPSDKQEINVLFEQADLKMNCLEEILKESFPKETENNRNELKAEYINYWKFTTNSEMMSSQFNSVSESFYRTHNEGFSKYESKVKLMITRIHRL